MYITLQNDAHYENVVSFLSIAFFSSLMLSGCRVTRYNKLSLPHSHIHPKQIVCVFCIASNKRSAHCIAVHITALPHSRADLSFDPSVQPRKRRVQRMMNETMTLNSTELLSNITELLRCLFTVLFFRSFVRCIAFNSTNPLWLLSLSLYQCVQFAFCIMFGLETLPCIAIWWMGNIVCMHSMAFAASLAAHCSVP